MEHALDELFRFLRLMSALLVLQALGPIVVVIAGRWWLPRVKALTLGVITGAVLGALDGMLCTGCRFVWQAETASQWVYIGEGIVLSALYGAIVALVITALHHFLSRRRTNTSSAAPAA